MEEQEGEIKAGNWRWSSDTLDHFIAPKLSLLTECNAPDISTLKAEHLLQNFILNSRMHGRADNKAYAYLYNYVRRTQGALSAYKLATEKLKQYVDGFQISQKISVYLESLFHFEIFLFQAGEAYELIRELKKSGERLSTFYNFSKHTNTQIQKGNYLKNGTVAVWITNKGLELYKNTRQRTEEFHWSEILEALDTLNELALIIEKLPYMKGAQTFKSE